MANKIFAGVDEVGRGCLAGPVISCALILKKILIKNLLKTLKLYHLKIELKLQNILKKILGMQLVYASVEEIDKYNIFNASLLSMERAIKKLKKNLIFF